MNTFLSSDSEFTPSKKFKCDRCHQWFATKAQMTRHSTKKNKCSQINAVVTNEDITELFNEEQSVREIRNMWT